MPDPSTAGARGSHRSLAAAIGVVLATAGVRAGAAEDQTPREMPKIVVGAEEPGAYRTDAVSSPKFTAALKDTPQTVVVIPKPVIDERGATTLAETLRNTPGITLLAGEGGGASNTAGDSFFMRGFDATNSIFIDGVRDQGAFSRDTFNIETVEVLKGPSGAYMGRGNAAGAVNIVTKSPYLESFQGVTLRYGSADHRRGTIDLNMPLGFAEGSAVRLNALWQDGGVAGRDHVEREAWGVAPSIAFGLDGATRVILSGQVVRQDNIPDYGLPTAALPELLTTDPPTGEVDQDNWYGVPGFDFEDIQSDSGTLRIEHDFSDSLSLTSLTRYSENDRLAFITAVRNPAAYDPVTGLVERVRQGNERHNQNFTHQTNLRIDFSAGQTQHAMSTGIEYAREKQLSPVWTGLGTPAPVDIHDPDPRAPIADYAPTHVAGDITEGKTKTLAAYVFDSIELTERWQLNAGLRFERYETEFFDATPAVGAPPNLEVSDNLLSWNTGLVYKLTPAANLYAAVASTQTPPGGANFTLSATPANANNPNVDPQESVNYELGAKLDLLDGALAATAAVFRTRNTNVITTNEAGDASFDSEQRVDGVELGLSGQLTPDWQVFAGFAVLDAEFADAIDPAQDGAPLQWTPEVSGTLWTTWRLPRGITLGAGAQYADSVSRSSTNATADASAPVRPSYWVFDAMAAWQATDHLSFRLNVNNLADEVYAASLNNNGGRYMPGTERSFFISADFNF